MLIDGAEERQPGELRLRLPCGWGPEACDLLPRPGELAVSGLPPAAAAERPPQSCLACKSPQAPSGKGGLTGPGIWTLAMSVDPK